MGKKAENKAETKAENEKNEVKIKNQTEERLYSFILEMQCANCRKYFGLDVRRGKPINEQLVGEILKKNKLLEPNANIRVVNRMALYQYSFLLAMRCPHCKELTGLDVSQAKTVTNY